MNKYWQMLYSWPSNNAGVSGVVLLWNKKFAYNLSQLPQSTPCIYGSTSVDSTNHGFCSTMVFFGGKKKLTWKWTCAVFSLSPSLSPFGTLTMWMLAYLVLYHSSLKLSLLFKNYFFFFLLWLDVFQWLVFKLTDCSASSSLLLNPFSVILVE